MAGVPDAWVATVVLAVVSASLPFYAYGAWIILDSEVVTWNVLTRHLRFVVTGLVLTTVPVATWMVPRLPDQVGGLAMIHAFLGLQAYALLVFALTGIVRIFQVKREHDLYREPDPDVALDSLHEHVPAWRKRLRVGVFGYVGFWILAWLVGVARYVIRYF
jgi:hypothetical protein